MREIGTGPALVRQIAGGDERAWKDVVDRNGPVVWGTARAYSANVTDAEDVYQATWLLLAENLDRLRSPDALAGWLVTTARRESIRLAKARSREAATGLDLLIFDTGERSESPETKVLRSMAEMRLWKAFSRLSQRCQQLLRVLAMAPDASYAQVSEALGIARGTIGPKKGRCLAVLRQQLDALDVTEGAA
ncbi:sigma-70 family RNA polymerase sigma factor [Saccharopolyspora taberi]|uniref:Sigma-70 family RNA polymerase sigma factor n=1 Tax=Saccharopolyspora taberi TaxID=60895 RepID=A0ABN3VN13_9PSEU